MKKTFERADKNRSGGVDIEELKRSMQE